MQKKLEDIIQSRPLSRPKTKKWHVIAEFVVFLILIGGIFFLLLVMEKNTVETMLLFFSALFIVVELYLRFCLIQVVKCYQHYASDKVRRRCLCVPSCSEYAILSLKLFPLTVALMKIRKRLYKTCKGDDYILDFPCKRMNERFKKRYLREIG